MQEITYQPGAILHEAIVGAFRASGKGFEAWCAENKVPPNSARHATFGQSRGPKGKALLAKMIAAAGADIVRAAYMTRMKAHVIDLKKGAA
ncbi:hypothetical protein [Pseudorhodobacter sp.]|uniref:hypothetical protein n=1 Tax=Pseudorhodobacter sp. TaxID=1934400 RepID=UPI002647CDEF|nr:hypothetical protein [Pseudorhodobacter sp.]MDN5785710.1 hypothetical protein [Pseudorhodobacter sp.]